MITLGKDGVDGLEGWIKKSYRKIIMEDCT